MIKQTLCFILGIASMNIGLAGSNSLGNFNSSQPDSQQIAPTDAYGNGISAYSADEYNQQLKKFNEKTLKKITTNPNPPQFTQSQQQAHSWDTQHQATPSTAKATPPVDEDNAQTQAMTFDAPPPALSVPPPPPAIEQAPVTQPTNNTSRDTLPVAGLGSNNASGGGDAGGGSLSIQY